MFAASPAIPLLFVPACGAGPETCYQARAGTYSIQLSRDGIAIVSHGDRLRLEYVGGRLSPPVARVSDPAVVHDFRGSDPAAWRTGLPTWREVGFEELYPGVSVRFSSAGDRLKSEYTLAPGAAPDLLRFRYDGATGVSLDPGGRLLVATPSGIWLEEAPIAWQVANDGRRPVPVSFHVDGTVVSFEVGEYDPALPLIIDPTISFSTLFGGSGNSVAQAVYADNAGNVYAGGYTDDPGFPSLSSPQARAGGVDAVIVKLRPSTSQLIYAAWLGGSGDDRVFGLTADASGQVYATGWTTSTNFPTASAWQSYLKGSKDAFVAKLSANGGSLMFSTYYGGTAADSARAIVLDGQGRALIAGETDSTDLPVTASYQSSPAGYTDAFVARFTSSGSREIATYLGGPGRDRARGLAVDASGNIIVVGGTESGAFPRVNALQNAISGAMDAFITKFNPTLTSLVFSTFLGGTQGSLANPEEAMSVATDASSNIYVGGVTNSTNFPVTQAAQPVTAGLTEGWLAKLPPAGTSLSWCTYLGGSSHDLVQAVAVDGTYVYAAGYTYSTDFPAVPAVESVFRGTIDAFLTAYRTSTGAMYSSSFLGGSFSDAAYGVSVTSAGKVYVAGGSGSQEFPSVNPVSPNTGTGMRMFVTEYSFPANLPQTISVSPAAGTGGAAVFQFLYRHPNGASNLQYLYSIINSTASGTNGCYIMAIRGVNGLYLVNSTNTGWLYLPLGTGGVVSNNVCSLVATGSSIVQSATDITVSANVYFLPAHNGARNVYMKATDTASNATGWDLRGTYTVAAITNYAPSIPTVNPSVGSGVNPVLVFTYSDANGASDLTTMYGVVNTSASLASGCAFRYSRGAAQFELASDDGNTWTAVRFGTADTAQNSRCTLSGAGASASQSGLSITVVAPMAFKPAFGGAKSIYAQANDILGSSSGLVSIGAWNVVSPPGVGTATLPAASGSGGVFVFNYSLAPANSLQGAVVSFVSATNAQNSCVVTYLPASSSLQIINDSGSPVTAQLGSAQIIENSRCRVNGSGSSITGTTSAPVLTVLLTLKPAFAGNVNVLSRAWDNQYADSGDVAVGAYTVDGNAPAAVSLTPASGSFGSATLTQVFEHPGGAGQLQYGYMLIHNQISGVGACYTLWIRGVNGIYLVNDSNTGWQYLAFGGSGTVENSACRISAAGSSILTTSTTATIALNTTFKAAFNGPRNAYLRISDLAGKITPWSRFASYTIAAQ